MAARGGYARGARMNVLADPLAQELLVGATIATLLILLGVLIGVVLAKDDPR